MYITQCMFHQLQVHKSVMHISVAKYLSNYKQNNKYVSKLPKHISNYLDISPNSLYISPNYELASITYCLRLHNLFVNIVNILEPKYARDQLQ